MEQLDKNKLLENPLVNRRYRYTEHELRKRIEGYKKTSYNALSLVENIDIAIENEKHFCESIELLKNEVGSNVGLLITELRE